LRALLTDSTDGAEVLWDFGRQSEDPADQDMVEGLVVVRSGQQVFRPVVRHYLTRVSYEDGWTRSIQLPQYKNVDVLVDPWLNGGQPTVSERGVRVADIVNRLKAREPGSRSTPTRRNETLSVGFRPVDTYGILAAFGRDCAGAIMVLPDGDRPGGNAGSGYSPMTPSDLQRVIGALAT
jgi:hypothetical protein